MSTRKRATAATIAALLMVGVMATAALAGSHSMNTDDLDPTIAETGRWTSFFLTALDDCNDFGERPMYDIRAKNNFEDFGWGDGTEDIVYFEDFDMVFVGEGAEWTRSMTPTTPWAVVPNDGKWHQLKLNYFEGLDFKSKNARLFGPWQGEGVSHDGSIILKIDEGETVVHRSEWQWRARAYCRTGNQPLNNQD